MEILKDIVRFIMSRKKLWLLPSIIVLMLIGGLVVFAASSGLAPFIYTLF